MHLLLIQVVVVLFSLYAATRALARYRKRTIGWGGLVFWILFWLAAAVCVLVPDLTQRFARVLGVGRGADAVFYVSLVGLSYAFFRLYLRIRLLEQELTLLVRRLAIKEAEEHLPDHG
jgi:small membrane protein